MEHNLWNTCLQYSETAAIKYLCQCTLMSDVLDDLI
jgi:hypothetical protein